MDYIGMQMRKWRKTFVLLAAFILIGIGLSAQNSSKVVKIDKILGSAMSENEFSILEDMIASYVIEMKTFKVIDSRGTERALQELENALSSNTDTGNRTVQPLSADYILSGKIGKIGEVYVFTLENTKVNTGEKMTVTENCASVNDIVLKARSLTLRLFDREAPASEKIQPENPGRDAESASASQVRAVLDISMIVGSWKGDKGLETVRIFRDGKGIATLSGGSTLKIASGVENGRFVIKQDQPNSPTLYSSPNISYQMARQIAEKARPMSWVFALSPDQKTLSGTKESVGVQVDSGGKIFVDNTYTREAEWTRIN
jgi:hypothetical protein